MLTNKMFKMRYIYILLVFLIIPFVGFSQVSNISKGAAIIYTNGVPIGTPREKYDSEFAINISTSKLYRWNRTTKQWVWTGSMIGYLNSSSAPSTSPKFAEPEFLVNNDNELYWYNTVSGSWVCLNCASVTDLNGIYSGSGTVPNETYAYSDSTKTFGLGQYPSFPSLTNGTSRGFWYSPTAVKLINGDYTTSWRSEVSLESNINRFRTLTLTGGNTSSIFQSSYSNDASYINTVNQASNLYGNLNIVSKADTIQELIVLNQSGQGDSVGVSMYLGSGDINSPYYKEEQRAWGIKTNIPNVNNDEFHWIKVGLPGSQDTTGNNITFYEKYSFPNIKPSITLNDTSVIAWRGDGTNLIPLILPYQSGGGGSGTDTSGYNLSFTRSNDTIFITDGNGTLFVKLPADSDNQILSIDSTSVSGGERYALTLSNGNTVYFVDDNTISDGSETIINSGTGISISGDGTGGNPYIITNSSPDQTVSLTNGGGINISGTYPNFTLTTVDQSITNEIQTVDTFEIVSNTLRLSLLNDAVPFSSVNLAPYLDNTDAQNLTIEGSGPTYDIAISGGSDVTISGGGIITLSESPANTLVITATEVDGSITNEIQQIDTFEIVSNILRASLSSDGVPFKSVDLSSYLDNTDDQTLSLDSLTTGGIEYYTLSIESGNNVTFSVPQTASGVNIYNSSGTVTQNERLVRIQEDSSFAIGITWANGIRDAIDNGFSFKGMYIDYGPSASDGGIGLTIIDSSYINYSGINIYDGQQYFSLGVDGEVVSLTMDTISGITFSGQHTFPNYSWGYKFPTESPSYTLNDTSILAWVGTGSYITPIFIPKPSGSGGTNIYNSDGNIKDGGTFVNVDGDDGIIFTLDADASQTNTFIRMTTDYTADDAFSHFFELVSPSDSLYITSYDNGISFDYAGGASGTALSFSSNTTINYTADSLTFTTVPAKNVLRTLWGGWGNTLSSIEGTTTGQVLIWDEVNGYWELGTVTDDQTLSIDSVAVSAGLERFAISIESGNTIYFNSEDRQDLSLSGNTLSLTNDATTVDLSSYLDNTDAQSLTITGASAPYTIDISGGTDISINSGTGISLTESPANTLVITNSSPDQTVVLNNGTAISITGTYPNFTITNTSPNVTTDLTFTGASSPYTLNSSDGTDVTFAQGTGISLSRVSNELTITNTVTDTDDQNLSIGGTGPYTLDITDGTGITITSSGIVTLSETPANTLVIGATEVDGSITNEGSLTVVAGGSNDSEIQSNTSGSSNVIISGGSGIQVTESGQTITIAATASGSNYQVWLDENVAATAQPNANFLQTATINPTLTNDGANTETEITFDVRDGSIGSTQVTDNSLTATDLNVNVVSSVDGVTNDGGNIDLVQGGIVTITPDDGANTITISAVEVDGSITNEIQTIDTFTIVSNILRLSLLNDNVPFSSVDLSSYLDNTDDQVLSIDSVTAGSVEYFTIGIESGNSVVVSVPQGAGDGNGIYSGNGNIPASTVATVASTSTFTIDYNSGSDGLVIDDNNSRVDIYSGDAATRLRIEDQSIDLTSDGFIVLSRLGGNAMSISGTTTNLFGNTNIYTGTLNTIDASAILEIDGTNGGLLIPRLTTTQRNAIGTPADGLILYNTESDKLTLRANSAWVELGNDESTTNEIQTISAGDGTGSDKTLNLSLSGGAVVLREGSNVTLSRTVDTITIAATPGAGTTDLTFTGASSPYTLNSSTGTDVTFASGTGISLSRVSNELTITNTVTDTDDQNLSIGGTGPYTIDITDGTGITVTSGGIVSLSESPANTLIISATEVDGSVSNELQTVNNTSDATSHTVTLSNSGGSIQLIEGTGITLTTGGTALDGTVTIASTITDTDDQTLSLDSLVAGSVEYFTLSISEGNNVTFSVPQSGGGTVTNFSAGDLSPLFTTTEANTTTTPALSFVLSNAGANTYFGNATGSSAAPSYTNAGALTKVDDTNVTLTLGGNPATSLLRDVSLTLGWTGTLAETRGGTGTGTYTTGDILYASATNTLSKLPAGTDTHVLTLASGVPSWAAVPTELSVQRSFIESTTGYSVDLDANVGNVKDIDGSNVAFTVPTNTSRFKVYKNGQLLSETGSLTTRDYSVNTSTHVLTLAVALISSDRIVIEKF